MTIKILFFSNQLLEEYGGMEMHGKHFIKYFEKNKDYKIVGVISKDKNDDNCLIINGSINQIKLNESLSQFYNEVDVIFFNSGHWINELEALKVKFTNTLFVYRTGGNEIIKAPLDKNIISNHIERQKYWATTINKNIDVLVTNSNYTEKRLIDIGVEQSLFYKNVGGVNVSDFKNFKEEKTEFNKFSFVCAARFVHYKNHEKLIEVFKILKERGYSVELLLIGDGSLLDKCKALVSKYGLKDSVFFKGPQDNLQVLKSIYNAMYYIQLSAEFKIEVPGGSYIHAEGMGRSILEAISLGTHVITTNTGALSEIINAQTGTLINTSSVQDIAEIIIGLITTNQSKMRMSTMYSWENYFAKYDQLFKEKII